MTNGLIGDGHSDDLDRYGMNANTQHTYSERMKEKAKKVLQYHLSGSSSLLHKNFFS